MSSTNELGTELGPYSPNMYLSPSLFSSDSFRKQRHVIFNWTKATGRPFLPSTAPMSIAQYEERYTKIETDQPDSNNLTSFSFSRKNCSRPYKVRILYELAPVAG